ncbi:hypothetical protein [Acidovorax sp.]|uniref:hypothetical protein n=1 Tax=Acidovorax sp. TaxID=1872122 RepID=UPI0025C6D144|nr:hypothetical protein [Acidovorax sp.]
MAPDPRDQALEVPIDVPREPGTLPPGLPPPLSNERAPHVSFPGQADPAEHPAHQVPEHLPLPPGDLPPSEQPTMPPQPQLPTGSGPGPYAGEVENEEGDPVGQPPRV